MIRYARIALALALVAGTAALGSAQEPKAGVVTTLEGSVTAVRTATQQPVGLRFKDDVFLRDRVTTGDRSLARMLLGGKVVVTVRERSTLTISEVPGRSTIELASGKIGVAVARERMRPGEQVEIRTPNAVAAVRGTVLVAEVVRATAQAGSPPGVPTTNLYLLRGTAEMSVLDAVTRTPVGPPQTLGPRQSFSVTGTSGPRVGVMTPQDVTQATSGLQPRAVSPTEAGNRAEVREQAVQTAATLVSALVGGPAVTGSGPITAPSPVTTPGNESTAPRAPILPPFVQVIQEQSPPMPVAAPPPPPTQAPPEAPAPAPPPPPPAPPPDEPEVTVSGVTRTLAAGETLKTFTGTSARTMTSTNVLITNAATLIKPAIDGVIEITPDANASLASPLITVNGNSIVDTFNGDINSTIAGVALTDFSRGVAVTPNGARAYVVGNIVSGNGFVDVVDTATSAVITSINLGSGAVPSAVAITPDGSRAFVTDSGLGQVSIVNTATNTVTTTLSGFSGAVAVAVTPDGAQAYVVVSGAVKAINTATNGITTIPVTGGQAIAVTPGGTRAYLTVSDGESSPVVTVIDTATNTLTGSPIGSGVFTSPRSIVVGRDGTRAYVADGGRVRVINTLDNTLGGSIQLSAISSVTALALTPDGSRLYAPLPTVLVILNTTTEVPTLFVTVDLSGTGMLGGVSVTPDGGRAYVTVTDSGALQTGSVTGLIIVDANLGAPLVSASGGGKLVSTSTNPLVQFDTATVDVGAEIVRLTGRATAVATEVADGVTLSLGTDEPIRTAGPLVQATNAAVSAQRVLLLDTALYAASAPILSLTASTFTGAIDAIDLLQKAKLTSVGPVLHLDQSTLTINAGAAIRVTGGSLLRVTGDLLALNNGAAMNLVNGPVLRVSGNSVVNVSGAFVNFGGTGNNQINVTNTLCSTSCITFGGIPVFLQGGATTSQVSIANAIRNPSLGSIVRSNASTTAVIVVDGPSSRVTITGQ